MVVELELLSGKSVDEERHNLVTPGQKKDEGLVQRLMLKVDEHVSVKLLMRVWGPRFEFVARCMLVATFYDDSLHSAFSMSALAKQIAEQGCLRWLWSESPEIAGFLAFLLSLCGVLVQLVGSSVLLASPSVGTDAATTLLVVWTVVQPVVFSQLGNREFVAESLSLVGGLLTLRAHVRESQRFEDEFQKYNNDLVRFFGRLLLPATYVYYAGCVLFSAEKVYVSKSVLEYLALLSGFLVDVAAFLGIAVACALVAAGLKSRAVALALSIANVACVFYRHPFLLFLRLENGTLDYDDKKLYASVPHAAVAEDVHDMDFEPKQIYDLHRYYFFMGLSASGALLLLASLGPGHIAVEKNELILPMVNRARD